MLYIMLCGYVRAQVLAVYVHQNHLSGKYVTYTTTALGHPTKRMVNDKHTSNIKQNEHILGVEHTVYVWVVNPLGRITPLLQ